MCLAHCLMSVDFFVDGVDQGFGPAFDDVSYHGPSFVVSGVFSGDKSVDTFVDVVPNEGFFPETFALDAEKFVLLGKRMYCDVDARLLPRVVISPSHGFRRVGHFSGNYEAVVGRDVVHASLEACGVILLLVVVAIESTSPP